MPINARESLRLYRFQATGMTRAYPESVFNWSRPTHMMRKVRRLKNVQQRAHCLPLEQRIRLYNEVLELREHGLSYNDIIERIHRANGVRLNKSHVFFWVHGLKTPLGNVNKFVAKPSPTLAYIIGVKAGDGYSCRHGRGHEFGLNAIDYEFAVETGRNLAKLLGRKEPYRPRWDAAYNLWHVKCCSVLLYRFLQQPFEALKPYIGHCGGCVAAFLRGFFDSEGGINARKLRVTNTDKELLFYVQRLLQRYFGIETTGPHRSTKAGYRFCNPRNNKTYETKKTAYKLYIRVRGLAPFHKHIGFTISRKQLRLIEAIQN